MYCPRCGRQPVSTELRFCSYCGFKLGIVKASLAEEDEAIVPANAKTLTTNTPPRHRNINIGLLLMFLGMLLSIVIHDRPGGFGRQGGKLIFTAFFAVILLSSSHITRAIYKLLSWGELTAERLSASKRELGFGATLMFLTTAAWAILSFFTVGRMRSSTFFTGLLLSFSVLLVISPYLLLALRYLIREESDIPTNFTTSGLKAPSNWTLPPAQELPTVEAARVITAELGVPVASVTEHTTGLLREK